MTISKDPTAAVGPETADPERIQAEDLALQLARLPAGAARERRAAELRRLSDDDLRREIRRLRAAALHEQALPPAAAGVLCELRHRLSRLQPREILPDDDRELAEILAARYDVTIAADGLIEISRITQQASHLIGELPLALYHHTATSLLPAIRHHGLLVGRQTNFFNSQAGVYLSTCAAGQRVRIYAQRAARVHGGEPCTVRVRRRLNQLRADPDDADLEWAQGVQFISEPVPPQDLVWSADDEGQADDDGAERQRTGERAPRPAG